jgi:hypothetical protein
MRSARTVAVGVLTLSVLALVGCSLFQNRPPVAVFVAHPIEGHPAWVTLDASGSTDPDGDIQWYYWELQDAVRVFAPLGYTTLQTSSAVIGADFGTEGEYLVRLTVMDKQSNASVFGRRLVLPLPPED